MSTTADPSRDDTGPQVAASGLNPYRYDCDVCGAEWWAKDSDQRDSHADAHIEGDEVACLGQLTVTYSSRSMAASPAAEALTALLAMHEHLPADEGGLHSAECEIAYSAMCEAFYETPEYVACREKWVAYRERWPGNEWTQERVNDQDSLGPLVHPPERDHDACVLACARCFVDEETYEAWPCEERRLMEVIRNG